jgi:hypothetical protein
MNFLKKIPLSLFVLIFVSIILFLHNLSKSPWRESKVIQSDTQIYYSYLPATFIQNDPFFEHKMDYDSTSKYWTFDSPTGRNVPKMTMGVAFLQLPFFVLADNYTKSHPNYLRDGFSEPYQHVIAFSSVFYTILGLLFVCLFLRTRFSELVTSFTIIFIAFGTNLYHYSVYDTGMSHTYTFFLLSVLLLFFGKWKNDKSWWKSIFIGLIFGLIVLIRPINILFILPIFMMYKPHYLSWKEYIYSYVKSYKSLLFVFIGAVIICLPQLLFWKIQSGNFLYFSYQDEGFFWLKPHVFDGLFSFRKGWFIYTPMMFFALFGMFRLYKTRKEMFWAITIFLPLFLYVTFSWWCWWYGGSFSARTLVDILPFMSLPLAAVLEWIFIKKMRALIMLIPFAFIYINLFQSWQFSKGFLHYDSMTYEGYKEGFLRSYTTLEYYQKLRAPDYENAKKYGEEKKLKPVL